ncbi:MAG TPA: hypothetical protein VHP31_00955 [Caproicibacter sp.]|nr:hypothetical protein [Caproicibacter sp.]
MNIINFIPFGRENAISRKQLCTIAGLPDRVMRHDIEKARQDYVILNIGGSGYFRPTAEEKPLVERWMRQERSRERSVRNSTQGAEKFLKGGTSAGIVVVNGYTRRKNVRENEKPQIEGQIRL